MLWTPWMKFSKKFGQSQIQKDIWNSEHSSWVFKVTTTSSLTEYYTKVWVILHKDIGVRLELRTASSPLLITHLGWLTQETLWLSIFSKCELTDHTIINNISIVSVKSSSRQDRKLSLLRTPIQLSWCSKTFMEHSNLDTSIGEWWKNISLTISSTQEQQVELLLQPGCQTK